MPAKPTTVLLTIALLTLAAQFPSVAAPTFASAVTNGVINIPGLTEASGIAASRNNASVLWTHNDSGHAAQVFAIDGQGRLLGTYNLPGNTDNEDIGIGPGPATNALYLYVGDIGDNNLVRPSINVYQIPEPAVYARQYTNPVTTDLKGARTITLTYPDGAHDAESMFIDPLTGDLFILTKEATSQIYTASKSQLDTNDNVALTFLRTLDFSTPSAADISPSGNEIIVRRESFAELWTRGPSQTISNAFDGTPFSIPVTGVANGEPNGEAIGFDWIGSGYFTVSDNTATQPLRYFARTSNDGPGVPRALVSAGSTWKFLDNGSNQGTAWRNPAFNDSSWSNGVAQFGYGDGDEQTVISYGGTATNKYVTTYLRKTFIAYDVADITNLLLKLVVDDGAAVYLNGTPILNYDLVTNPAYSTLASTEQPPELENTWLSFAVAPGLLINGTNTLAVEIHQGAVTSSNMSFDLQLLASFTQPAYDPFDYTVGTPLVLVTNATGQWWTAAGTSVGSFAATVVGGNLPVPGLSAPNGSAMQFGAVDGPSARFNLTNTFFGGTVYFSFPFKVIDLGALSTNGGYIAGFNNTRGTQTATPTVLVTRILVRATGSGGFNIGTAKNTTNTSELVWSTNVFSVNETIFLVGSYTSVGGFDIDVSKLWINPSALDFGFDPPAPTLVTATGKDITSHLIATVVFLQRGLNNSNQPAAMIVDEVRVGTTWSSVTPPGLPLLNVGKSGNQLNLSWPSSASDFVMESNSLLSATSAWNYVSSPVSVQSNRFALTIPVAGTNFYRLRKSE